MALERGQPGAGVADQQKQRQAPPVPGWPALLQPEGPQVSGELRLPGDAGGARPRRGRPPGGEPGEPLRGAGTAAGV